MCQRNLSPCCCVENLNKSDEELVIMITDRTHFGREKPSQLKLYLF